MSARVWYKNPVPPSGYGTWDGEYWCGGSHEISYVNLLVAALRGCGYQLYIEWV